MDGASIWAPVWKILDGVGGTLKNYYGGVGVREAHRGNSFEFEYLGELKFVFEVALGYRYEPEGWGWWGRVLTEHHMYKNLMFVSH